MAKYTFNEEIYTFQVDFAHHVSNIEYVKWMEIGRLKILRHIGLPIEKLEQKNITPVLIHTEIDFKKPLYIGNKVKIDVWISELKNASAEMSFNFFNDYGDLVAFGKQVGLFVSMDTKKPLRISNEVRKAFEKVLPDD